MRGVAARRISSILRELPPHVKLVVVTKNRSIDEIKAVINSGIIIAENRIQEAWKKYCVLEQLLKEKRIEFHFIGHLQSNKAKKAVEIFDMIQSIDSLKIAYEVDKRARNIGKVQDVLIQVNIGREKQKHGVMPEHTIEFFNHIKRLSNIRVRGLMCIAPKIEPEKTRPYFRKMKQLFDKLKLEILSMGMTNDYKIAIEEGSNMIRLGRAIFQS